MGNHSTYSQWVQQVDRAVFLRDRRHMQKLECSILRAKAQEKRGEGGGESSLNALRYHFETALEIRAPIFLGSSGGPTVVHFLMIIFPKASLRFLRNLLVHGLASGETTHSDIVGTWRSWTPLGRLGQGDCPQSLPPCSIYLLRNTCVSQWVRIGWNMLNV